tara:strand:- start:882 stop:1202 length:321 start_codon:yes stop_codon:yes gene_type:complete
MAIPRKIKCDCGEYLKEKITVFDNIKTKAMVCPKCGFATLTKEQAKEFVELKHLHRVIDAERKIIKIGNSMGFTLPDTLKEFGARVGKKLRIEALSHKSFKVELMS